MDQTKKALTKLALDFSLLLILAALVAVVSVVGLKQVNGEYQQLIGHSVEISRLASKINTDFQRAVYYESTFMQSSEKDGIETAYEQFVIPHQQYTERAETDISHLKSLISQTEVVGDKAITSDLDQIAFDIETYKEDFAQIVTLLERRGSQESGLEAILSQKVIDIDANLKQHPDQPSLQTAHLQLQLAQQTYLTHRSSQDADHVHLRYVELVEQLERATLTRRETIELERLVEAYYESFQAVVQIDEELFALQQDVDVLVDDVRSRTDQIDATAQSEAGLQLRHVRQITAQTTQLVTMSVIIIAIFAIGLGFAMYYQLNRGSSDLIHTAVFNKESEPV